MMMIIIIIIIIIFSTSYRLDSQGIESMRG